MNSAQNSSPPIRNAAPRPSTKRGEPGAEPDEQRVAGRVAERVVVVLEAVEVEEDEHAAGSAGVARGSSRSRARASARRLPSPVSASVCASSRERAQHAHVVAEGEHRARHHRDERGGRRARRRPG